MAETPAIIFDLDGTLADSAPAMTRALNVVWRDLGRPETTVDRVRGYIGDGPPRLIARARQALGLDDATAAIEAETAAFLAAYAADGPGGDPYPDALAVVTGLAVADYRLAVCTNKPQAAAERFLEALGFAPFLAGVVGGDAAPARKPDPAHVLAALDRAGGDPATAVLVGDGLQDVTAAEAAGLGCIVAAYGYGGAAAARPDLPAIDAIAALPAALAKLRRAPHLTRD